MELSWISTYILRVAFKQLKNADYYDHALIDIGDDCVLIDKDEFEDLKEDVMEFFSDDYEEISSMTFEDIVKAEGEDNA